MIVTFTNRALWVSSTTKNHLEVNDLASRTLNSLIFSHNLYQSLNCVLTKSLNRSRPSINKTELMAAITIFLRPLSLKDRSNEILHSFCSYALTIPGLILHAETLTPEIFTLINANSRLNTVLLYLEKKNHLHQIFQTISGGYSLSFLANIIHWSARELSLVQSNLYLFVHCLKEILSLIQSYIMTKQSSSCHWHPLLGWFTEKQDSGLQDSLAFVREQLRHLWSPPVTKVLFHPLFKYNEEQTARSVNSSSSPKNINRDDSPTSTTYVIKKAFEKAAAVLTNSDAYCDPPNPDASQKLLNADVFAITLTASLYISSLKTLSQARLVILTGLCHHDDIIVNLWQFIRSLDSKNGLATFVDHLTLTRQTETSEFHLLILFCECANHLIT